MSNKSKNCRNRTKSSSYRSQAQIRKRTKNLKEHKKNSSSKMEHNKRNPRKSESVG